MNLPSERIRHEVLEIKQNVTALGSEELVEEMFRPDVTFWQRTMHYRQGVVIAKFAAEQNDDDADRSTAFSNIEENLRDRLYDQAVKEVIVYGVASNLGKNAIKHHGIREQDIIRQVDRVA